VLLILSILLIGESVSSEGSGFVQSHIPKMCAVNFINILIFFSFWTYISQVTPQQLVFSSVPRIYNIKRAKRSHVTRDPEQTKTISVRNEKELNDLILTFQEDRRYSSPRRPCKDLRQRRAKLSGPFFLVTPGPMKGEVSHSLHLGFPHPLYFAHFPHSGCSHPVPKQ
jgi:hypothetical protein